MIQVRAGVSGKEGVNTAQSREGRGLQEQEQACASLHTGSQVGCFVPHSSPASRATHPREGTELESLGCRAAETPRACGFQQTPRELQRRSSGVQSSACFCNCFDDASACSHHYRDATALLMTTIY